MLLPVSRLFRLCLCLCALRGAIPVPRPDIWLHKARTYRARWFGTGAVARKHCMRLPQPPNSLYIMEAYGVCVCVDAVILYMPLLLLLWVVRTAALFVKLWWIFYTFMKIYEHWTCKIHHFGGKSGSGKANALLVLFMSILDPNTTHPTLECYVHFSHESRIQKLLYMMICDVHRARRCCTPPPRLNWAGVFILRYFCSSRFRFSRNSFFFFFGDGGWNHSAVCARAGLYLSGELESKAERKLYELPFLVPHPNPRSFHISLTAANASAQTFSFCSIEKNERTLNIFMKYYFLSRAMFAFKLKYCYGFWFFTLAILPAW